MLARSLTDRCDQLAQDLLARPMRIGAYHDLPFAILRYDPAEEYAARKEQRLLARQLEMGGRAVVDISFADILWQTVDACESRAALFAYERQRGFALAHQLVTRYFSDPAWDHLLPDLVARRLAGLDPTRHVAFLTQAAALAPGIYHMSHLLDELHGKTLVPTILWYPGTLEGTTGLRFMDIPDNAAMGNYRVKIY